MRKFIRFVVVAALSPVIMLGILGALIYRGLCAGVELESNFGNWASQ